MNSQGKGSQARQSQPASVSEFRQTATVSKSTLAKAIGQAKRMTSQGKFDDKAKVGFLKLLAKEAQQDIELDDQQWKDWIEVLRGLVASPDLLISSDALKVLAAIYASHPEQMEEETPRSVQEYQLGKLVATKTV